MFFNRKTIKPISRLSLILGLASLAVVLILLYIRFHGFAAMQTDDLCCQNYLIETSLREFFYKLLF